MTDKERLRKRWLVKSNYILKRNRKNMTENDNKGLFSQFGDKPFSGGANPAPAPVDRAYEPPIQEGCSPQLSPVDQAPPPPPPPPTKDE